MQDVWLEIWTVTRMSGICMTYFCKMSTSSRRLDKYSITTKVSYCTYITWKVATHNRVRFAAVVNVWEPRWMNNGSSNVVDRGSAIPWCRVVEIFTAWKYDCPMIHHCCCWLMLLLRGSYLVWKPSSEVGSICFEGVCEQQWHLVTEMLWLPRPQLWQKP